VRPEANSPTPVPPKIESVPVDLDRHLMLADNDAFRGLAHRLLRPSSGKPADGSGVDIVGPRDIGLRFAISESLEGLLPLEGG
jgi:hypothetical protein